MSRRTFLAIGFLLAIAAIAATARAQRAPFAIPDPDPEVERKSFILADGFEVNLFAADPVLAKPVQMNFDPRGRLWVVSSEVYPQIEPGQKANDKVLILEDADGDGRAESTRVFADGLPIPTGVEPGDNGVYVANRTELLHLASTLHNDKADYRRVVLSGFGTEDTHHILHTLRWGYDGRLYFNQSISIHTHIETPHGERRLGGGGVWHFRPETMELGVFIRGLVNTWGHHIDRWGESFTTDGAGGTGFARCEFDVSTSGPVMLRLDGAKGLTLWLDGTSVDPAEAIVLDLSVGVHTLTFAVNPAERPQGRRCVLDDLPGSPARAQVVTGK